MALDIGWPRFSAAGAGISVRALVAGAAIALLAQAPAAAQPAGELHALEPLNVPPIARLHVRADSADAGFLPLLSNPAPVYPAVPTPRPGYQAPVLDPVFGTRFLRITNDSGAVLPPPIVGGTW